MPRCKYCGKEIIYIQNLSNRRITACDPERVCFRQVQSCSETYDAFVNDDGKIVRGRQPKPGEKVTYGYIPHKYTCEEQDAKYRNSKR